MNLFASIKYCICYFIKHGISSGIEATVLVVMAPKLETIISSSIVMHSCDFIKLKHIAHAFGLECGSCVCISSRYQSNLNVLVCCQQMVGTHKLYFQIFLRKRQTLEYIISCMQGLVQQQPT